MIYPKNLKASKVGDLFILFDPRRHFSIEHAVVDAIVRNIEEIFENDIMRRLGEFFNDVYRIDSFDATPRIDPFEDGFVIPIAFLPSRKYNIHPYKRMTVTKPTARFRQICNDFAKAKPLPVGELFEDLFRYWRLEAGMVWRKSVKEMPYSYAQTDDRGELPAWAYYCGFKMYMTNYMNRVHKIFPEPGEVIYGIVHEGEESVQVNRELWIRFDEPLKFDYLLVGPIISEDISDVTKYLTMVLAYDDEKDEIQRIRFGKRAYMFPVNHEKEAVELMGPVLFTPSEDFDLEAWFINEGFLLSVIFDDNGDPVWFEPARYDLMGKDVPMTTGAFAYLEDLLEAKPTKAQRI